MAALLFKLDYAWQQGFTNKACTSLPAGWGQPTTQKKLQPKQLNDMEWCKPHYMKHRRPAGSVSNPVARQLFSPTASANQDPSLESLMGSLFISCRDASVFQYAAPESQPSFAPHHDLNVEEDIEVEHSAFPPSVPDMVHILGDSLSGGMPCLTAANIEAVETATIEQSASSLWKEQRIGRITSSVAHTTLIKGRKISQNADCGHMDRFVGRICGVSFVNPNIPALKYGRTMEPVARTQYQKLLQQREHKNIHVRQCGLFVHPKFPFMGSSPDGIVTCDCCGTGVLEIKCPASIAHLDPAQ